MVEKQLQELLAVLSADADAELAETRRRQEQEAEQILERARTEARTRVADAERAARAVAEAETAMQRGAAAADAARVVRAVREERIGVLYDAVRRALEHARKRPDWDVIVAGLVREGLRALPEARAVHVHPRDVDTARALLDGSDVAVVGDLEGVGGAVLADDAGGSVDNRIETRLAGAWPRARNAVAGEWDRAAASHDPGRAGSDGQVTDEESG